MDLLSSFGASGFGGTGGGHISRFWRFCWKTKEGSYSLVSTHIHTHSLPLRHPYLVLVGHDELLNSLLPLLEHLGALVVEQGELLQHHVLGRLDLGAQVELRGLGV